MKKLLFILNLAIIVIMGHAQQQFTSFQNASFIIGQSDFLSTSTDILNRPAASAISSQGMFAVVEQSSYILKVWHSIPDTLGTPYDVEISLSGSPNGICWSPDGSTLITSSGEDVYIWKTPPTTNEQIPDVILNNLGGNNYGVEVAPNGKLLVAQRHLDRILVWNAIPDTNDTPANYAIGQPDLTTYNFGTGPGELEGPWGIDIAPTGQLLIADSYNDRIVIYDSVPETYGDTATKVIGQSDFYLSGESCTDSTLSNPIGVTVTIDGIIAVGDFTNNRFLLWDSIPTTNGERATVVLGQPDFYTSGDYSPSGSTDSNNVASAYSINTDLNGRLYAADRDANRILIYGELPEDSANLSIDISLSSPVLCDSSSLSIEATIENAGPDNASNIVATMSLPYGFNLEQSSVDAGIYNMESGYWNIPELESGQTISLRLNGYPDTSIVGDTVLAFANILNSSAIDTNLSNNGTSDSLFLIVAEPPAAPVAADASICAGQRAELSATGEGTLVWYSSADAAFPLGTGSPFTTDVLNLTTSFFVESQTECPSTTRTEVIVATRSCANPIEEKILTKGAISIYPNPASDMLTVELPQNRQTATISLINTMGATIIKVYATSKTVQLHMNEYPAGIYILRVNIDNKITDSRIIKE